MKVTRRNPQVGSKLWAARSLAPVARLVFLGALSASPAKGGDMLFYPAADTWLSSCSSGADTNRGDHSDVWIRTAALWGDLKNFRGLLHFDLSGLPIPPEWITEARLNLYFYGYHWDSPEGRTYNVYGVTSSWVEMECTWRAREDYYTPSPVYWDSYLDGVPEYQPGGGDFDPVAYAQATVPAPGNWMSWEVTDPVREWVGEVHPNLGLLIKDDDEFEQYPGYDQAWGPAHFYSSDYYDEVYWPYLEVSYVIPGDIDDDQDVDLSDFGILAMCYGSLVSDPPLGCSAEQAEASDLDGNGRVNLSDFGLFALNYGFSL